MRLFRIALFTLPLALSACSVPGLIAEGVKSYEHSQDGTGQAGAGTTQPAPTDTAATATAPQPAETQVHSQPEVTPVSGGYRRDDVTAEPMK